MCICGSRQRHPLWRRVRVTVRLEAWVAEESFGIRSNNRPAQAPRMDTLTPCQSVKGSLWEKVPLDSLRKKVDSCTFDFGNGGTWSSTGEGDIPTFSGVIKLCWGNSGPCWEVERNSPQRPQFTGGRTAALIRRFSRTSKLCSSWPPISPSSQGNVGKCRHVLLLRIPCH